MKHRVLFVVTYLDCGGINRALQNLLNRLNTEMFDVSVFAMVPDGMFISLYKNCHILPRHYLLSALMARYVHQKKGLKRLFSILVKGINRLSKGAIGSIIQKNAAKRLMKHHYDTVVAFSEGAPTAFVELMNHSNTVAWIHCDYASYWSLNNNKDELRLYSKYNHIVCVADYPRLSFLSYYPELSTRTTTIYNILDDRMIKSLAQESVLDTFCDDQFSIVSVGRLDPVKRLSIVPKLSKRLSDAGCQFKWFVIGPKGGTLEEYEKLVHNIVEYGMEDRVFYLGEKENPYSYISRSDLLVNTSISEACPYVINEAKLLHTPVICPDFGSAPEFVDDGVNGFICAIEDMADIIIRYIKDKELQNKIKESLSTFIYDNESLLRRVEQVIS